MSLFIERLDNKLVNISLIQTIYVDPEDDTDVLWLFINGEVYREDLATAEEASKRLEDLKGLLLGTTVAELEKRITEQQQTIVELNKQVIDLNEDISDAVVTAIDINGEDVGGE